MSAGLLTARGPTGPGSFGSDATCAQPRDGARAAARWRRALAAWLVPSLADVLFLATLLITLRGGSRMISGDGDAARHLVVGEQILRHGAIPRVDLFSHTMAGAPFVPYEWLAEVSSALAFHLAGLAGTVLLHGAAIAATIALLFGHLRQRGTPVLLALAVTILAGSASALHWLARPHVFTLLGTALFSMLLDGWQAGRGSAHRLWLLPALMVVWANAHGGFLIGLILIASYAGAEVVRAAAMGESGERAAARQRLRTLAPVALATAGATLLNPAGPGLLGHVTGYLGKRLLVDRTNEYLSPNFHELGSAFFLAMLLLCLASFAWSRRRPALHEGALALVFAAFGLYSARNIPLFAMVAAPVLAAQLAAAAPVAVAPWLAPAWRRAGAWLERRNAVYARIDGHARGHLWPALALAGALAIAAAQQQAGAAPLGIAFDARRMPVAAAAFLRAHPPAGNGFNELAWGGYLLHELWPAERVFIDGQTDFYGEALAREYLQVVELQAGWQDVLDRHQVTWVIYPTDSALTRALAGQAGWHVTYQDGVATVLERAEGTSHPL